MRSFRWFRVNGIFYALISAALELTNSPFVVLLMHLEDAASPLLESRAFIAKKPSSLKTSDRRSLLSFIGLPLNLFGIVREASLDHLFCRY